MRRKYERDTCPLPESKVKKASRHKTDKVIFCLRPDIIALSAHFFALSSTRLLQHSLFLLHYRLHGVQSDLIVHLLYKLTHRKCCCETICFNNFLANFILSLSALSVTHFLLLKSCKSFQTVKMPQFVLSCCY